MDTLIERSIFILRETKARFKKPAVLWSSGKDSTALLALCHEAFMGSVPFPVIHIDNGIDFPETYAFRERLGKEWDLDVRVAPSLIRNDAISGISCCGQNKTEALKKLMEQEKFDSLIVGIRRDEHGIRSKERVFSPRDEKWQWNYEDQPVEAWGYTSRGEADHHRVHPLLDWLETDVWRYMQMRNVPVHPLYFAHKGKRFRSLGCTRCTVAVRSEATTLQNIIDELNIADTPERMGRAQDKEDQAVMERLRALGYM
jgi:sulfate adenylyltransferase subunit 2